MYQQLRKIDKHGCIELPKKMREKCGILPESDVLIELKDEGIYIKPKLNFAPITKKIAEMELLVSDWETMEHEIIQGHQK